MNKKYTSMVLMITLIFILTVTISGGSAASTQYFEITDYTKDETVYINLGNDGAAEGVEVVNRLEIKGPGIYIDHGIYEDIRNLTDTAVPTIESDAISWTIENETGGFYYQGTLFDVSLPFMFLIKYTLDGIEMTAEEITGKSGRVTITVDARPDPYCPEYFRSYYFCQIQAALALDSQYDIISEDAVKTITGNTMNLGYTILPGRSAEYTISFDTDNFEFGGFTITCLPFSESMQGGLDIDGINEGFDSLSSGSEQLINGTRGLMTGLALLSGSMDDITGASYEAETALDGYSSALGSYTDGLGILKEKAVEIAQSLKDISGYGDMLHNDFVLMRSQIELLLSQLEQQDPDDPPEIIEMIRNNMSSYESSLLMFTRTISMISAGMDALSSGISELDDAGTSLIPALKTIIDGMSAFTEGLASAAEELAVFPEMTAKIIDSQVSLKSGIDEARTGISSFIFTDPESGQASFVSEKNDNVRSVQFIYRTPGIKAVPPEKADDGSDEIKKSFFEKFIDLFR